MEKSFPLIIFPKKQNLNEGDTEIIPFVQFLITRKVIKNLTTGQEMHKIAQIDFSMQELSLKVEQKVILTLVSLMNSIYSAVTFHKVKKSDRKSTMEEKLPWEYNDEISPYFTNIEDIILQSENSNNIFIEALCLSALRFNLTLRIDISTLQISIIPRFLIKFIGTVGNAIARITDSPLKFSELILQYCYTDVSKIVSRLSGHYTKQVNFFF